MKKNGFFTGILYVMLVLLMVGLGLVVLFNYEANREQQAVIDAEKEAEMTTPTPEPMATPEPTAEPERNAETVTLAFAGDLVGQAGLTTDAKRTTGDAASATYDFTEELRGVRSALENADLAACTLVSTLTSGGEYDAYLMPSAVASAMYDAGFELVNAASDHILDRGLAGLTETVGLLRDAGLGVVGAYDSASRSFPMADVHGIKVAFLSYTYSTASGTGESVPVSVADNSWCLDLLTSDYMTDMKTVDYDKIDADIAAVRQAGADVVVCFVYWWDNTRYYTEPRANQTEVVDHLLQSGVDILVGGGVKSPQPIETRVVERADGNVNCVVCYSLSNLMSCFTDNYTDITAVAQIQISRDVDTGDVWISNVRAVPLFMQSEQGNEVGSRYRLLDAEAEIARYDAGGGNTVSQETYDALKACVTDLASLMGAEYFTEMGYTLGYPYEASGSEQ